MKNVILFNTKLQPGFVSHFVNVSQTLTKRHHLSPTLSPTLGRRGRRIGLRVFQCRTSRALCVAAFLCMGVMALSARAQTATNVPIAPHTLEELRQRITKIIGEHRYDAGEW